METVTPLEQSALAARIRLAAKQAEGSPRRASAESVARGELPAVSEPLLPPPLLRKSSEQTDFRPGVAHPLLEATGMIPRARGKTTVGQNVPAILRPLFRNQGGFNSIVLEALERLVEVNQRLQRQNQALHERLMDLSGWIDTAAGKSSADHDWMVAVENRLRGITETRLVGLEERLANIERTPVTGEV